MEFAELYTAILTGRVLKLQFGSKEELAAFRNSFAVYCHRQTHRLIDCGMADEFKDHSLQFSIKDCMVEVRFAVKEKRKYNFTVIQEDDSTEEGKE